MGEVARWGQAMTYLGLDPGAKGAIAIITAGEPRGVLLEEAGLPWVAQLLKEITVDLAVIEKVGAMPGQGVTSMFTFGENYGKVQGILIALDVPHDLVHPQAWRKEVGLMLPAKEKGQERAARSRAVKEATVQAAIRRWPSMAQTLQKVKNWPIADALFLAECARLRDGVRAETA